MIAKGSRFSTGGMMAFGLGAGFLFLIGAVLFKHQDAPETLPRQVRNDQAESGTEGSSLGNPVLRETLDQEQRISLDGASAWLVEEFPSRFATRLHAMELWNHQRQEEELLRMLAEGRPLPIDPYLNQAGAFHFRPGRNTVAELTSLSLGEMHLAGNAIEAQEAKWREFLSLPQEQWLNYPLDAIADQPDAFPPDALIRLLTGNAAAIDGDADERLLVARDSLLLDMARVKARRMLLWACARSTIKSAIDISDQDPAFDQLLGEALKSLPQWNEVETSLVNARNTYLNAVRLEAQLAFPDAEVR